MKKLFIFIFSLFILTGILLIAAFGNKIYFGECSHSEFIQNKKQPTCDEEGYTINKCTKCSYEYTSDRTPPTGHSLFSTKVTPSCDTQGYTLYYCACGYSFKGDFLPSTEHEFICYESKPTCDAQGYKSYSCAVCDYSYCADYVEPTGHSFKSESVLPTATRAGYTKYTCQCSYSYIGDRVYYSDILESAYTDNAQVLAKGIDVSRWNHQIDPASGKYLPLNWEAIKSAGFDFVILKAGSTKSGAEPTFEMDYSGAKAAGLQVGVYFYTYSMTTEGILKDAQMLMTWLEGKQLEYPVYLDIEDPALEELGKNHLSNMCVAFLEALQENGYYAGLYTNHAWLTTILDTAKMVSLFDLWYARYPGTSLPTWNQEKYGKQLAMWQYTQSGSIAGIEGDFDFNYVYKDYLSIMKKWGLNGY